MAEPNLPPEVMKQKIARRAALRNQFLKEIHNPHRHATGEGGVVFDSAIQRYTALRVTYYDHFKPTPKTARYLMFVTVIPILGFAYLLETSRQAKEHLYRTGQVSYADRKFKFA